MSADIPMANDLTKLIVVTGGPGGGKTALLELLKKVYQNEMEFLHEAASILFGGGFPRRASLCGKKASQRAIFHIQREQERVVQEEKVYDWALCDRGTLDGLAYWPNSESSFYRELNVTHEDELSRYWAVVHMRTPSKEGGYNHQNPLRHETAEEAFRIDKKIEMIWKDHPRYFVIDSADDFILKVMKAHKILGDLFKGVEPLSTRPK